MSEAQRFIAAYDIHFGWEKKQIRDKLKVQPTHDLEAVNAMLEFAVDFKPHVFILGGDQLNCGPVSKWLRGAPRLMEGFRLKEEMDLLDRHVLLPVDAIIPSEQKGGRKIWLEGNHEYWIRRYVDEHPEIEGLVEPGNFLRLAQRKWEYYAQGEVARLGKIHFVHGDSVFPRGCKSGAQKLVSVYRRNVRAGHLHTSEMATDVTPADRSDYHTGIIVPALASCSPAYVKNAPTNFQKGFLFGYVMPDGSFSDYIAIINRGRMIWNGKIYGRKG